MDPEKENMNDYTGAQPMNTNPWEVLAYPKSRYEPNTSPKMLYLPSVELI
jgi:hypothetical protein